MKDGAKRSARSPSHEDELVLPAEILAAIAEIGQIINSSSVTKDAFEKIGRRI